MSIKIIIKNKSDINTEYEFLDENLEIKVNSSDNIFIKIDINLIKLKVINNNNLEITFSNKKTILLENLVLQIFQNELQQDNISTLNFLFNVEEEMNYKIDSMKTLFDAIDFTAKNFTAFDTNTTSLLEENKDILFDEENFLNNKDEILKNTEKNDLIFYDELVKANK